MIEDHGSRGGHGGNPAKHSGESLRREPLIFAGILATGLLIPVALLTVFSVPLPVALLSLAVLVLLAALLPHLYEFKEYERGVVFTLGKYERTVGPGWVLLFPAFQSFERVDLRTQVLDIAPQEVITKEDLKITIDTVAYIRIVDPKKAVIEIKNVKDAIERLLHGEVRQQIGKLPLQDVLEKSEELNEKLFAAVKQFEDAWGIKAINVEIENIKLPEDLENAFRKKQEAAENRDRVQIDAMARREVLRIVNEAAKEMDDRTITYLYLDTLKKMADGKSTKIVFPIELMHLASHLEREIKGGASSDTLRKLAKAYLESSDPKPATV
ncbi:MAG TPA: SPFH domain-containing protein [Candidatus Norongarragalinales archaeon]|nr:SPFH domain-containing protein [Candidatus Norongarragalinales archaeon]